MIKITRLLFFSIAITMLAAVPAMATITDTAWTGTGYSLVLNFNILEGAGKLDQGYSFGLTTVTGSNYNILVENSRVFNTFNVFLDEDTDKYFAQVGNKTAFELGDRPEFKFAFYAPGDVPYSTYDLTLIADTDCYDYYVLNSEKTGIKIGLTTKASPVPIPGAALLLGSSLLGLVGIGCRRKKKRKLI